MVDVRLIGFAAAAAARAISEYGAKTKASDSDSDLRVGEEDVG